MIAAGRHASAAVVGKWVSDLSSPVVVNPVTSLVVAGWVGAWVWGAVVGAVAGGLPAGIIARGLLKGRITDRHVTNRRERPVVMLGTLSGVLIAYAVSVAAAAPVQVRGLLLTYFVVLAVLSVITLAGRWKVSAHAAVIVANTVMVTTTVGVRSMWLWLLPPVVMWARVRVREHSRAQVLVGAAVGLAVAALTFGPA